MKPMKQMKQTTISAETYRRILDGLEADLEAGADACSRNEAAAQGAGLSDLAEAASMRKSIYEALAQRIRTDLEAAQQEAEQFTGLDA